MGSILAIMPYNLKREKRKEFGEWLKKNEDGLRQAISSVGGTYRGTFLGALGLAPVDGVTLVEYSSYEDLDAWRELDDPKINKLLEEMMAFNERCEMSTQIFEQAPDGLTEVVLRKHKGKRIAK
jgi:hypothetical protein